MNPLLWQRFAASNPHIDSKKTIGLSRNSLALLAAACAASLFCVQVTHAANPPGGTVDPSTTTPVEWDGTAIGTGGTDEASAIEGVNRDTFVLHVTPGDYTGKTISVKIEWTSGSNDYDLFIHKRNADGSDGDLVSSSGGGVPSTSERTVIDPNSDGAGDFNIIACTSQIRRASISLTAQLQWRRPKFRGRRIISAVG